MSDGKKNLDGFLSIYIVIAVSFDLEYGPHSLKGDRVIRDSTDVRSGVRAHRGSEWKDKFTSGRPNKNLLSPSISTLFKIFLSNYDF